MSIVRCRLSRCLHVNLDHDKTDCPRRLAQQWLKQERAKGLRLLVLHSIASLMVWLSRIYYCPPKLPHEKWKSEPDMNSSLRRFEVSFGPDGIPRSERPILLPPNHISIMIVNLISIDSEPRDTRTWQRHKLQ